MNTQDNYKFKDWLNDWLKAYKSDLVSYKNIVMNIRLHIPENLKNKQLKELTAIDIQKALNGVKKSRTRLDIYSIYNNSLKMAYKHDLMTKDISQLIEKPKHIRNVGKALSKIELLEFIENIKGKRIEKVFMFCLYSGCRRSEALALTYNDIDFENKTIHIKGTKTKLSDRYIPLFKDCEDLLLNIKDKQGKLFKHRADYLTKEFKKVCSNHKLHDLRHTFATRCLECGINIKVVQKWLGHSRLDTTASIYTHCQDEFVKSEALKFRLN